MKLVAFLAASALALGAPPANAALVNGGFETGDFTGWSVSPGGELAGVTPVLSKLAEPGDWLPVEGSYFGLIASGAGEGVYSLLSQAFTAAAGDRLSFAVFFDTEDVLPFNDNGYANLLDGSGAVVAQLYFRDVAAVGDEGSSGWDFVSYTFTSSGTFRLEFGVTNIGDNALFSVIGVDAVSLTPVPAPAGLVLAGSALACWGSYAAARRRAARARA